MLLGLNHNNIELIHQFKLPTNNSFPFTLALVRDLQFLLHFLIWGIVVFADILMDGCSNWMRTLTFQSVDHFQDFVFIKFRFKLTSCTLKTPSVIVPVLSITTFWISGNHI